MPVNYLKGRRAKSPLKGGPLAVFETRRAARDFMNIMCLLVSENWKIVKCLYVRSNAVDFWEYDKQCKHFHHYHGVSKPKRTAFADSVTCLE